MELRVLRYFLAVAREETVTGAAEVLNLTQPTLSRQLSQLEAELGVRLFCRSGRRLTLTAEGMVLRRRAEEILDLADRTVQELTGSEQYLQGTVAIGTGDFAAFGNLAECMGSFARRYPLVRFRIFSGTADEVLERLKRGTVDLGLLLEPVTLDDCECIRLPATERFAVFVPPEDPLAEVEEVRPADLAGRPLIVSHRWQSVLRSWLGEYGRDENMRYVISLVNSGAVLAARGLGCLITLRDAVPMQDPGKLVCRPVAGMAPLHTLLAWKRGMPAVPAVERFLEHLKAAPDLRGPETPAAESGSGVAGTAEKPGERGPGGPDPESSQG